MWYAALPVREWPADSETLQQIAEQSSGPWGDRRQELVFIGTDLGEPAMKAMLDQALLTERELAEGPASWAGYDDPFPAWGGEPDPIEAHAS